MIASQTSSARFWLEEYERKATSEDPLVQTGRGSDTDMVEFLHLVRYALNTLDLRSEHDLLDVGAANGLMSLVLSGACRSVLAVEPVPGLVAIAEQNLASYANARAVAGSGSSIPVDDQSFDRVLVWGVVQFIPASEIESTVRELKRVARPGAKLLLGSIPDAAVRDEFLGPYLDGVRTATHLTSDQKTQIEQRNLATTWHDETALCAVWRDVGGQVKVSRETIAEMDARYRFNLEVTLP